MQFSEKLKKLRQENNLTQAELADKLYVTRQAVTKWENGRGMPETNIALEIAKLFNVSLDYLMDDTQEKLKDDISNDIKATKKPKKLRPLIKAIILGASLICITGCVLIGSLIYYKHKEDRFEKQEHTIGYYITINEMHTYTIEEILDKDIPCVFSNWLDVNMLDQRKYIYDNEIYIPKKNNVYLYEINYIIKTDEYKTKMVLEISNNNKWEQYYNYHKEEKDLRGYSHFIECNIYLLDEVEKFNVIAIDINSNVVLDLSYKLTSLGRIESNKGEILEFLPEQIVCENAIQCYIEYITSEGECVKKLFTMNDDIMTTRLVVFMHKGNEYVAHNFKVCLYFR